MKVKMRLHQQRLILFVIYASSGALGQTIPKQVERFLQVMHPEYQFAVTTYATDSGHPFRMGYVWVNKLPSALPFPNDVLFIPNSTPCELAPEKYFPHGACLPRFMPQDSQQPGLLFQAVFQFAYKNKGGFYYFFGSTVAANAKNLAFKGVLHQHPEWTDEDRTAQLKSAGGKFGPGDKDKLLESETMKRLRRLVGPCKFGAVKFLWSADYPSLGFPGGTMISEAAYWRAEVFSRKDHRRYLFIIEPMEGEVTTMLPLQNAAKSSVSRGQR